MLMLGTDADCTVQTTIDRFRDWAIGEGGTRPMPATSIEASSTRYRVIRVRTAGFFAAVANRAVVTSGAALRNPASLADREESA